MKKSDILIPLGANSSRLIPFASLLILIIAGLLGCLSIYSARAFSEAPLYFALKQLVWLTVGILIFLCAGLIPFSLYRKTASWLFVFSLASLVLVLFFGVEINGMHGWFRLGKTLCIQPSEFAKVFFLLWLSVLAGQESGQGSGKILFMFGMTFLVMLLLMLEPDFGGALIFFVAFLIVLAVCGTRFLYLGGAVLFLVVCTAVFVAFNDYALVRILGYLAPDGEFGVNAWHIKQFQYTMAHGGWSGSEWGNALWSSAFLPLPHTDSLFASIVESTGFIGAMIVIGGFFAMGAGFTAMSWKIHDCAGRVFVFGTGAMYLVQALIHISVNSVLLPPTGVTLPVLSYGGSSLLSIMFAFGIAFSAAREDRYLENSLSSGNEKLH